MAWCGTCGAKDVPWVPDCVCRTPTTSIERTQERIIVDLRREVAALKLANQRLRDAETYARTHMQVYERERDEARARIRVIEAQLDRAYAAMPSERDDEASGDDSVTRFALLELDT